LTDPIRRFAEALRDDGQTVHTPDAGRTFETIDAGMAQSEEHYFAEHDGEATALLSERVRAFLG
jgi:hypothetical protein